MTVPAAAGKFGVDSNALNLRPRGTEMMIALPNMHRPYTCTVFCAKEALDSPELVADHFTRQCAGVADLMPTLQEDFRRNPVGSLVTIRCWPRVTAGMGSTVALVGDAGHAIVPFFGQGASCAFEDCLKIDRCLDETADDWPAALELYQTRRKPNAGAIAEMALDNFVEMRDRVASPVSRARAVLQHALERWLGERFVSRYELVFFKTTPYDDIPARLRPQSRRLATAAAFALTVLAPSGVALHCRSRRSRTSGGFHDCR